MDRVMHVRSKCYTNCQELALFQGLHGLARLALRCIVDSTVSATDARLVNQRVPTPCESQNVSFFAHLI